MTGFVAGIRDRVLRFNVDGPNELIDRNAPGQPPKLNDAHRQVLSRRDARNPQQTPGLFCG